jgi:hypothetical protein
MLAASLIAVVLIIALPLFGNWLSARSLKARIELLLTSRHRDFLRSLKLGSSHPALTEPVDPTPDYITINGVVQRYEALFTQADLLRQLGDPELDALVEQLQRRWWR